MMALLVFAYLLALVSISSASDQPKQWALLVAGSNGFYNYRHQADVCHSYQILHRHGIPDEQIVVMMYDDIANNSQNPFPGAIYNTETGPNQYKGVLKDYTGENVTPENFLNVLQGNAKAMQGIGSGKVINSGPGDNVFVYFADHGGTGIIGFPNGVLSAHDLIKALKNMHDQNKYKKLVFYMEACDSGSMFKGLLPPNWNIYATSAANATISSWACDCPMGSNYTDTRAHKIGTCLNDCYSVNWLTDSDRVHLNEETLHEQFEYVKHLARLQVTGMGGQEPEICKEWGDLNIGRTIKLSEFMGRTPATKHFFVPPSHGPPTESCTEAEKLYYRHNRMYRELQLLEKDQTTFKESFKHLIDHIVTRMDRRDKLNFVLGNQPGQVMDTLCHKYMNSMFTTVCGDLAKKARGINYHKVFENLCRISNNLKLERLQLLDISNTAMIDFCKSDYV